MMIKLGIQGGKGSFNEASAMEYIKENPNETYEIVYLYDTRTVFERINDGSVDLGQFALLNGVGGVVQESILEIAKNNFEVVDTINLPITHHLMQHRDSLGIKSVMAHPQVFRQCKVNLPKRHPELNILEGEGDLIDTSIVAKHIHDGNLPNDVGVLGPMILADIYDLVVVDKNLQDSDHNVTTFVVIKSI